MNGKRVKMINGLAWVSSDLVGLGLVLLFTFSLTVTYYYFTVINKNSDYQRGLGCLVLPFFHYHQAHGENNPRP